MRLIAWFTRGRRDRLDRHWQQPVDRAEEDKRRFDRAIEAMGDEMVRADMARVGLRLEDAVREVREAALHGQRLDRALDEMPNRSFLEHQLHNMLDRGLDDSDGRVSSARYQLEAIDAIRSQIRDVDEALERIDADIDLVVTQAIETDIRAGRSVDHDALRASLDDVVSELDALNKAMDELDEL